MAECVAAMRTYMSCASALRTSAMARASASASSCSPVQSTRIRARWRCSWMFNSTSQRQSAVGIRASAVRAPAGTTITTARTAPAYSASRRRRRRVSPGTSMIRTLPCFVVRCDAAGTVAGSCSSGPSVRLQRPSFGRNDTTVGGSVPAAPPWHSCTNSVVFPAPLGPYNSTAASAARRRRQCRRHRHADASTARSRRDTGARHGRGQRSCRISAGARATRAPRATHRR